MATTTGDVVLAPSPVIRADKLSRTFGEGQRGVSALKGLTCDTAAGSQWAVTGPSGSGKSTLLYLLGALDRPTAGRLTVGGRDWSALSPADRALYRYTTVGLVFQEFQLIESLAVWDNVRLPFVGRRRERRMHEERARWLLEAVGMGDHLPRPAGVLSGGEKQRGALARALVNDPLLLCDEPTGNLDQATGVLVMDLIQQLAAASPAKTLVVITHDPGVAGRFAHQLHLRDGELVA